LKKVIAILFFFLFVINTSQCFHIIGGEITYSYVGNNVYHIKVKVYRDCASNGAQFDDTLHLGIFNNNNINQELYILFPGSTPVTDPVLAACIIPPDNICVEQAIYETNITLPPITGGYDIVYQRCCRNSSIVNIELPEETGATYVTHINPSTTLINNAAFFNTLPPIFLCLNTPFNYDHSAADLDGDSLVYSFCEPYSGASNTAPMPSPPSDPPYSSVNWTSSYNGNNQISSNPQMSINPNTGQMQGTPNQTGQFVIGVKVREYRNGIYIGETRRDFQFNILFCNNAIASIPNQETFCNGLTVNFNNTSFNSTNYYWDFGDNTVTTDNSALESPSYTYPSPGNYTIMLVAYNLNGNCFDTAYSTFEVTPLLAPTFTAPTPQCFDGNSYQFNLGGSIDASATYNWDFGQFSSTATSNSSSPNGIHFTTDTALQIQAIVSQFGCSDTLNSTMYFNPKPKAIIGDGNRYCIGNKVDFENLSINSNNYFWNFGVSGISTDTSTKFEPSYTFADTGIYNISLIATNNFGCSDTISKPFWVFPLFSPTIYPFNDSNYVNQCVESNIFNFYADGIFSPASTFIWNFGSQASINSASTQNVIGVTFNSTGFFPITVTAQENGCIKSYTDSVKIYNHPRIGFEILSIEKCLPATILFNDTSYHETPLKYYWDFGDLSTSNTNSPTHVYSDSGTFYVSLSIVTETGCKDSLHFAYPIPFKFIPKPIANFVVDSLEVSFFNPTIQVTDSSSSNVDCSISISDGTEFSNCSFTKTFIDTGYFSLTQTVHNADDCIDTMRKVVHVKPEFRVWVPNSFSPNNDGINDTFLPYMLGIREFEFSVYDRWGALIFFSEDKKFGWDGKFKNKECSLGVYNYIFYYVDIYNKYETRFGKIVLIR